MIERISELPFFGPEEQLRKFICQADQPDSNGDLHKHPNQAESDALHQKDITQQRIGNIDDILQKQLIWSYGISGSDDAYFYWDWCPSGTDGYKWKLERWDEFQENLERDVDRNFNFREFVGVHVDGSLDEMPQEYFACEDKHAKSGDQSPIVNLDKETLMHNIMRSYIEVSEWLGDGALKYGSHNGFVSRKMSMCWLFDAIRALINYKLDIQDRYAEKDIIPLNIQGGERFLENLESSPCGVQYTDALDLDQTRGVCSLQAKVRSSNPQVNGTLKVRGNEWHYGERATFYTHNSFVGECRFFHNARFLGQTTFDKEIAGTALRSRWSDICEYYVADKKYEPGTLIMFGGDNEMTISDGYTVNGIVTTKPGFILNGDATKSNELSVGIALVGRVPVNVVGKVYKFDKLVPSRKFPGYAIRKRWYQFFRKPIGIALSDSNGGQVECVTKLNF